MRRVFAFFVSRPFVGIGMVIAILTLINVALVFAVVKTDGWQLTYLQNGSIFVGHVSHEGAFIRIRDVHLLKPLSYSDQKAQTSHYIVQGAIDPGFDVQDFELSEVVLSQSEIRLILDLDDSSPIISRLNQLHSHE